MPVTVNRVAPKIYHVRYEDSIGVEEISSGMRQIHNLATNHDEYEAGHYVIIYHNHEVRFQINFNFQAVRGSLKDVPEIKPDDSIFVNFPPAMRMVVNTMHRVISRGGDLYFVDNLAQAVDKAHELLRVRDIRANKS